MQGHIRDTDSAVDERTSHKNIGISYTGGSFGSAVDGKRAKRAGSSVESLDVTLNSVACISRRASTALVPVLNPYRPGEC